MVEKNRKERNMIYNEKVQRKYDRTKKGQFRKQKYELSKQGKLTRRKHYLENKQKKLNEKIGVIENE